MQADIERDLLKKAEDKMFRTLENHPFTSARDLVFARTLARLEVMYFRMLAITHRRGTAAFLKATREDLDYMTKMMDDLLRLLPIDQPPRRKRRRRRRAMEG